MIKNILAIGAVIGGIISVIAYLPQIQHLVKVKDSTGISIFAWYVWLFGNILLLIYAIAIVNISYIIVEIMFCLANLSVILLTYKYRKK